MILCKTGKTLYGNEIYQEINGDNGTVLGLMFHVHVIMIYASLGSRSNGPKENLYCQ